jgi:Rhodopirellula transposase DDE domain
MVMLHGSGKSHAVLMLLTLYTSAERPPGRWRYNVEELHPTCRATSDAVIVPDASIAFAALTFTAFSAGGRPPTPDGRAGRRPSEIGIDIKVHHLPPGTSKWNKIEHRLFSSSARTGGLNHWSATASLLI